jgi:DNA-binding transcriptional LysR family regulator
MQLDTLKTYCDIVRLNSFSRGAHENQLTQSAASQMVHHLEEHLGAVLIDRSHRPWKLTNEGKLFYEGCRDVLERYYNLENQVKNLYEEVNSVVRIACIYSVGLRHMSQYVESFSRAYPRVRIHIEYLHPDRVYEGVLNENMDLGIVSFPQSRRELSVIPWRSETMILACAPEHRFAQLTQISPAQISGERFVGFDKNLVIRKEIDRFLKKHQVEVEVVLEFDNIEAIKRAVEIASGISILPRPTLDREIGTRALVAVPLTTKEFVRPLGIIHRRGRKFNSNITRFIELLKQEEKMEGAQASKYRAHSL